MSIATNLPNTPQPHPWMSGIPIYVPGRASADGIANPVKLSSNENPFGPSPKALVACKAALTTAHRYPDSTALQLREALASRHGLEPDRIVCGNGSEEIIDLAIRAFSGVGDEVIHAVKGFVAYRISAVRAGATPIAVPDVGDGADVDALLAAVTPRTRIICLANPNNPTGTYLAPDAIARLHASLPGRVLLVLDEAYAEYAPTGDYGSSLPLASRADNVLVTRTFSKAYGLAALRIGWAAGARPLIEALRRMAQTFGVSGPAQAAALAALEDEHWVKQAVAHNSAERAALGPILEGLGLQVTPSGGNFILVRFADDSLARSADEHLTAQGVIVRPLPMPGLTDCLRISIGLTDENAQLVVALTRLHEYHAGRKQA